MTQENNRPAAPAGGQGEQRPPQAERPAERPAAPQSERPERPMGPQGERPAGPQGERPAGGPGGPGGRGPGGHGPGGGFRPRPRRTGERPRYAPRRKVCAFCVDKVKTIDYKDVARLRRFLSDRGKIEPRRKTGTCAKHQRVLTIALKRARHIALLPYTAEHIRTTGGVGVRS